jgi:galactonate dehydratase
MRISGIELTTFTEEQQAHLLVVRSDSGLSGIGEFGTLDGRDETEPSAAAIRDLLIGRDPFEIEALVADVKVAADGSGPDLALLSAATSAMLDLAGQSLAVPVHQLLGGRVRDHVRACAVGWAEDARSREELVASAQRTAESGYTVLRVDPFAHTSSPRATDLDEAAELVRAVRDALPDEIDLVVAADPDLGDSAIAEFADALAVLEPLWLEQTGVASSDPRNPSEARTLPRAAGRGADGMTLRSLATGNVVDHLVLEVGRIGGLLEARRIAALAEVYYTGVVPVGSGTAISLHAALQIAAVVPNLSMVEARPGLAAVEDGLISIDDRPGFASTLPMTEVGS